MMSHKGEINLLPQPLQVQRRHGLYLTRAQQFVLAMTLALLVVGGAYGGAWWWLQQQLREAAVPAGGTTGAVAAAAEVSELNVLLNEFEQRRQEFTVWTPLLSDIFAVVPAGVRLTAVAGDAAAGTVTVTGVAEQRAAIIAFQQALEQVAWVRTLTAPLSNLSIGSVNTFTFVLVYRAAV
jgi:Tfp pilus assembly protein PilN